MALRRSWIVLVIGSLALASLRTLAQTPAVHWTPAGWGGGGYYYAAAFHPAKDGVVYIGGDVNGVYKTEDHGKQWRIINNGIADYGVFTLAVDPSSPDTVYAATEDGLCKSTDAGQTWRVLPKTGKKELRLTGEKGKSVRCVAVDPRDSKVLYLGNPAGKIYQSTDGGETFALVYARAAATDATPALRVQFGGANDAIYGGIWTTMKFPATIAPADAVGIGFSLKAEGNPRDVFFSLKTASGASYRSRNLHDLFTAAGWQDVVLTAADFVLDPDYKAKNPEQAKAAPATPDWSTVNRFDLACVAGIETTPAVARIGRTYFAATKTTDGKTGTAKEPVKVTVHDFAKPAAVQSYGNLRLGERQGGPIYTVAVSPKEPAVVAAASADEGLLLSTDSGKTWKAVGPMKSARSVAFSASDPAVLYAACQDEQVWKSTDKGATWTKASGGMDPKAKAVDIAVSPANPQDVYVIGAQGWNGAFFYSHDGGQSWTKNVAVKMDLVGDPTLPQEGKAEQVVPLSTPTNIVVNPKNPQQLCISANWRSVLSDDGGKTLTERSKGMDITCAYDIRFHAGKTYVAAMDEGVLVSDDNGANWKQLWPLHWSQTLSGHAWRLDVREVNGAVRIISTSSPWDVQYNQVVISPDGGATFKQVKAGLPDYIPTPNTMWGRSYPRALAVDPSDPKIVYVGMDGDPSDGKTGGGVFKSTDGGQTWKQLPNQPGSRRAFFGLAVDPTNPKRVYWAACGDKGGLYRSEDGGDSWQHVFKQEAWPFNVLVTADGTVYCPGRNLWRSTDHGATWKQVTKFTGDGTIVGLEAHPTDPNTLWVSLTTWSGAADAKSTGVFKTTDGGKTWQDLTGDLPYRKPMLLRYNPATQELWAGGVGLYRLKQ